MLNKKTKVKICTPDGDLDLFNIITSVQQGDTLSTYLFITFLDKVLRPLIDLMKDNGFTLKKKKAKKEIIPRRKYYGCRLRR